MGQRRQESRDGIRRDPEDIRRGQATVIHGDRIARHSLTFAFTTQAFGEDLAALRHPRSARKHRRALPHASLEDG